MLFNHSLSFHFWLSAFHVITNSAAGKSVQQQASQYSGGWVNTISDVRSLAQSRKLAEAEPPEVEPDQAVPRALDSLWLRLRIWKAISHGLGHSLWASNLVAPFHSCVTHHICKANLISSISYPHRCHLLLSHLSPSFSTTLVPHSLTATPISMHQDPFPPSHTLF